MEADSASPARQDSHDADERAIGRPPSVEPGGETRAGLARWRSRRPPAVIIPSRQAPAWQLVVKHKAGSLDAAVASIRSRNLVISFGILALLAASTVMVFVSTERARRMADLQIQFVAGISHELRTPLAVISAAADNLNAGIVDSKDLIRKYGYLIHSQCMRLGNMIQHVLLFASTQTERRNNASARPINVAEVAQKALAAVAYMIESAHATAETHVPTDLPQIFADPEALSHCLQNLLSNAVKYGGEERWVSLRAGLNGGGQKPEVMITVEDHGLGMDPSELDHIFEPFYRGKAAAGGQIHGTGLGLAITKSLVEEMGGSLSVASVRGQGSVFTLHLPLASSVMVLAPGPVVDQGTSVPSGDSA